MAPSRLRQLQVSLRQAAGPGRCHVARNFTFVTEAGRELADPAGVAALAIRRMSPFCFFLELWDLVSIGTGSGPGGGGQTSLKLMDGRSPGEVRQPCRHVTFGLTLAPSWGSGLGLISGPFGRRFRDSFWSSSGAPKVSRKVARRHTESQQIRIPTWKASVARFSGF